MADEELKFPIGIPVETNAKEAAGSVESLRDQIMSGTDSIRAMAGTLRQLRGSTDEVKAAKAQLTAKIGALKDSVSAASLSLVKQGTTYDAAAQKSKKFAAEQKKLSDELKNDELAKAKDRAGAMGAAIGKAGGPVAALRDRLSSLKSITGETSGAMGLVTFAAAGAIAVVVALTTAVAASVVSLGKFVITAANAARSANLAREAWSGTAQNASNLGTQVDALAAKVPTSKAALNDLAIALMKSKLGGQATVDAFNAVGQATAALGDEAGGKIKEFIERGRLMGRMRIDPSEMLEGFGNLNFDDIAKELATGMNVSVDAARKALRSGAVKLGDGAKAMKDAVEKKFGDLNLRKMLDLNVMSEKLHEKLAELTKDVKLEPLLKAMSELGKLFDTNTVTGSQLKSLMTGFGNETVSVLTKSIPIAKKFFQGMVIGALEIYVAFLQVRKSLRETFGGSDLLKNVDGLTIALTAGKAAVIGLVVGLTAAAAIAVVAAAPFIALYASFVAVTEGAQALGKKMYEVFKSTDWKGLGTSIIDGLIGGIKGGVGRVVDTVKELGQSIKNAFTGKLEIHSPSKAFDRYGESLPEGATRGVKRGTPKLENAVEDMASAPQAQAGGAAGGRGGGPMVFNINIDASGAGPQVAESLGDPSLLAKITKAVIDALVTGGFTVPG